MRELGRNGATLTYIVELTDKEMDILARFIQAATAGADAEWGDAIAFQMLQNLTYALRGDIEVIAGMPASGLPKVRVVHEHTVRLEPVET